MSNKQIEWNGAIQTEAIEILSKKNGLIVSPTKVGYIIMATDIFGLERKFEAKQRKRNKPAVVLCSSIEQLKELAEIDEKTIELYQLHWDQDILLGCILPWSKEGKKRLVQAGTSSLVTDTRDTSCFVIKFGTPSEIIVQELWEKFGRLTFASSANPSGLGNKGKVTGIGEKIADSVDLIVSADSYVSSIQPEKTQATRYEQGVMLSLVDSNGKLITQSNNNYPTVIRKGLNIEQIMLNMTKIFNKWDYRQGAYY